MLAKARNPQIRAPNAGKATHNGLSDVGITSYCQKLCMDPSGGDPFSPDSVYKCDVFYDLSQAPVAL